MTNEVTINLDLASDAELDALMEKIKVRKHLRKARKLANERPNRPGFGGDINNADRMVEALADAVEAAMVKNGFDKMTKAIPRGYQPSYRNAITRAAKFWIAHFKKQSGVSVTHKEFVSCAKMLAGIAIKSIAANTTEKWYLSYQTVAHVLDKDPGAMFREFPCLALGAVPKMNVAKFLSVNPARKEVKEDYSMPERVAPVQEENPMLDVVQEMYDPDAYNARHGA